MIPSFPDQPVSKWGDERSLLCLVAEDDIHERLSLEVTLRRAGIRALVAESAEMLLEILAGMTAEERSRIDLLVTDLNMPGMRGEELIRKLDMDGVFLPVVVITSDDAMELGVEFRQRGCVTLLNKPFHPDELIAAAREVRSRFQKQENATGVEAPRAKEGAP